MNHIYHRGVKMAAVQIPLIFLIIVGTTADSFTEPSNTTLDLALRSIVSSNHIDTSYCVGETYTINPTYFLIKITKAVCKPPITGPKDGKVSNGYVKYDSSNDHQCSENSPFSPDSTYTLTFWVKHDCSSSNCSIILSGNTVVEFKQNTMSIKSRDFNDVVGSGWTFIALRRNLKASQVFTNSTNTSIAQLLPVLNQIEISPNLTDGEFFTLVDVRIYNDTLTDREVKQIYTASPDIESVLPYTDCRCPESHPTIYEDNNHYNLQCKDDNGDITARFKPQSVLPFVIDDSQTSTWKSNTRDTTIKMQLDQIYQIDKIELVMKTTPCSVTFTLDSGHRYTDSSDPFKWEDITSNINTRSDFEKVITKNITILLSGYCDSSGYHEITEIMVHGRCNCYGSAHGCTYNSNGYTCSCTNNTRENDCSQCVPSYYRGKNDFGCLLTCQCVSSGTDGAGQTCEQVEGQCPCKSNVEGRQCDTCKHVHYNLNSTNNDGCTRSSCDENGTLRCSDNVTCSTCECKSNVINPQCSQCTVNYYGINVYEDGCKPCSCNTSGTVSGNKQCHVDTGQCNCKDQVQGLQCDRCKDGFYGLSSAETSGCLRCGSGGCNKYGSHNTTCEQKTGQCYCLGENTNKQCDAFIDDMVPKFGPLEGGTIVTLTGNLFGSNDVQSSDYQFNIFMDKLANKRVKEIRSWNHSKVVFVTDKYSTAEETEFFFQWAKPHNNDTGDLKLYKKFNFRRNPTVTGAATLTSFTSGGCDVRIEGTNLNSVDQPKLKSYLTNNNFELTDCYHVGSMVLLCKSPDMSGTSETEIAYGLVLDGVTMYENLTTQIPEAKISFTEDPTILTSSHDDYKMLFSDTITIRGNRIKEACSGNLKVKIGNVNCKIESEDNEKVVCKPDLEFPGVDKDSEDVMVEIGNFKASAGKIKIISFWKTWEFIGIAIGVGAFVILILILVICCCCCRRRKKFTSHASNNPMHNGFDLPDTASKTNLIEREEVPRYSNKLYTKKTELETALSYDESDWSEEFLNKLESNARNKIQKSITDRKNILPDKVCTLKGTEIRVINGKFAEDIPNAGKELTIKTNVKTLKELLTGSSYPTWINNGLLECMKFQDCFHDNILRIMGISVDKNKFYVLYPASRRGFKEYLNDVKHDFTVKELLEMCLQVAEGMKYLSDENMVHKDLATRNCVIMPDGLIKISDSSFCWNLYPAEYMYDEQRQRYLPVRWMAIESLKMGFYDISSDVWSFGVLLYEVMTLSLYLPYHDQTSDTEIKQHIEDGFRLGMPTNAPDDLYNLMVNCWDSDNHCRPSFDEIVEQLQEVMNPESIYVNLETSVAGQHKSIPPVPQRGATINRGYQS